MAINCKIQLSGFLGQDGKTITKDGKSFVVLRVATTDSYPVKDSKGEVKWKDKESIWHDVLVFRPTAAHFARDLKKGDAVEITGSINYKPYKDESGYTKRQASILAYFIEKVNYERQEELSLDDINQALESAVE